MGYDVFKTKGLLIKTIKPSNGFECEFKRVGKGCMKM